MFPLIPSKDRINRNTTHRNVKSKNLKYVLFVISIHRSHLDSFCLLINEKQIWMETSTITNPNRIALTSE